MSIKKFDAEYDNFIGTYKDVFPPEFCKYVIENFDILAESGAGWNRKDSEKAVGHIKSDLAMCGVTGNFPSFDISGNSIPFHKAFFGGLQECYDLYVEKYSTLDSHKINCTNIKIPKTTPGEGYHVWHSEKSGMESKRVLVYILYLNTLEPEQAGETEFLYQQKRIKPVENTVIIWPAAFTHTHRGNTVFGEKSKYIITGWFYFE